MSEESNPETHSNMPDVQKPVADETSPSPRIFPDPHHEAALRKKQKENAEDVGDAGEEEDKENKEKQNG